jgi:hypothetical protein
MMATTTASHQWLVFFGGGTGKVYGMYPLLNIKKNYGRSAFLIGKSTFLIGISNSYVCLPEGNVGDGDGFN